MKNLPANTGDARDRDVSSVPGLGRSPGGGNGNPLQYSHLEKSMDREAWWVAVHGVTKELYVIKHAHILVVNLEIVEKAAILTL